MTVRLAHMIGMQKIMEVTKRFGINQNPSSNLSSVLGAEESTLMQITNAYAIIANGGRRVSPILMEKIQDRHGNVIYKSDNRKCSDCEINISTAEADLLVPSLPDLRSSVIDTRTAYQMTSMLEGAVKRGTSAGAKSIGKTVAGKTGTSNDSKDAWFIGYSPDLVVGIYIGYDIPRSIGKHATGARIALPVFNYFMKEKLKNYPNKEFAVPPGIKFAEIDQSTGMPPTPNTPKRDIVLEAFKLGTEPEEVSQIQPESEYLEEITKDSAEDSYTLIPQSNNSIDGTGGLY